jgi:hypothetical protein
LTKICQINPALSLQANKLDMPTRQIKSVVVNNAKKKKIVFKTQQKARENKTKNQK